MIICIFDTTTHILCRYGRSAKRCGSMNCSKLCPKLLQYKHMLNKCLLFVTVQAKPSHTYVVAVQCTPNS